MNESTCKECGQPLRWVKLWPSTTLTAIDAEPDPEGMVALHSNGVLAKLLTVAEKASLGPLPSSGRMYTTHICNYHGQELEGRL